jgi:hypothetical protein
VNAGGELHVISGNDTSIIGGKLHGDTVDMDVGGNLNLVTLQNSSEYFSMDASASVTFSMGGVTGMSASFGMANADRDYADDYSRITSNGKMNIHVGNNTNLVGSLINSESGELELDTATLKFKDLRDHDESFSFHVGFSTSGGGMSPASVGFSMSEKTGITRATVGEGNITVRSDVDGHDSTAGLNRDANKVQETFKDEHFGMHMTVPVMDMDKVEQEGKIVVPTAYAMYSTGWNTLTSVAISPLIAIESLVIDGMIEGGRLEETPKYVIAAPARAINAYNTAYMIGELAYEYNPEYLPALFGMNIPFIGTFIPGPEGDQTNRSPVLYFSGGIRDTGKNGSISYRDPATLAGFGLVDGETGFSGHYSYGSGAEVFSELFLGNTAPGLEFARQVLQNISENKSNDIAIMLMGHSGGDMRSAILSKYVGYANIGVYNADFSQGPAWGYYNNIQNATSHLSVPGDPVSVMGLISFPLLFSGGDMNLNISVLGDNAIHTQPFSAGGSEFDKTFYENFKNNLQNGQLPNYPDIIIKYFQPYERVQK